MLTPSTIRVQICLREAKVFLQIEPNSIYIKCRKSSHMSLIAHTVSHTSLCISPIWTPVITAEVKRLELHPL
jgi:hypothetical protein